MLYKKLIGIFIALIVVILIGIAGYESIEKWPLIDSIYMTVITLSSVGFMEVHPLSNSGRILTMFLILCGSGVLVYGVSVVIAFIVEGELTDVLRRRKMNRKIEDLKEHFIVCGADQTARYVIEELEKTKREFVVIEKDPVRIKKLIERDILCIEGDATHDSVLQKAGIRRAKGFITSLHSDAENVFVVITAKRLNPSLRVISKALEEESEQKIKMVGADCVVMPEFIGGLRMVSEMIRPSVVNFLDVMLRTKDNAIRIENIEINKGCKFLGKTLLETGIMELEGAAVVALEDKSTGAYKFNPSRQTVLNENLVLIVMGNVNRIEEIRNTLKTTDVH